MPPDRTLNVPALPAAEASARSVAPAGLLEAVPALTVARVLRIGAAMCFIGHGAFGILTKEAWIPYFAVAGIPRDTAFTLMPLVGTLDIVVGVLTLVTPRRAVLLYMAVWGLWTASLRPLTGEGVWELLERAGNYGVPLAFLVLVGWGASLRSWVSHVVSPPITPERARRVAIVLRWTTALLLIGHGGYGAFQQKALLATHYASVGLPGLAVPVIGWFEILLGLAVLRHAAPRLLLVVVVWKVATELLYPVSGAPLWEFIERGGSYAAPLALLLLSTTSPPRPFITHHNRSRTMAAFRLALVVVAGTVAGMITPSAAHADAVALAADTSWSSLSDGDLVRELRSGGYVLACRHAMTDHDARDRGRDRASQRNLIEEGVRQARMIGDAIRSLGIPIGEVRSNPMYRNRETAEYAFGRMEVDSTLAGREAVAVLRGILRTPVPSGTNHAIMTRTGILRGAFEGYRTGPIEEGNCVVVRPGGDGNFTVVAHLTPADWRRMR
jgi:hypothetical protein